MDIFELIYKYLIVHITAAEPEAILSKICSEGVSVKNVDHIDILNMQLTIRKSDFLHIMKIADAAGASCRVIRKSGLLWSSSVLKHRPVLLLGMTLFLLSALILPGRILFVTVSGNERIPNKLIIEQAKQCGIIFGSKRQDVRSEKVKNALLQMNPDLQWVGVNTQGCIAQIHIRERSVAEEIKQNSAVASIVAAREGIISHMVINRGTPRCTIGQQVQEGTILVSGYTDCGIKVQAESADGEVYAHTLRDHTLISPIPSAVKGEMQEINRCYRLKLGKKVINLWNHSGIRGATCDKIYSEKYWTLPGGFQLPVSLICEVSVFRTANQTATVDQQDAAWLKVWAEQYLLGEMIAGQIIASDQNMVFNEDHWLLDGTYACNEMIGQVKYEETLETNA